ncbi:MAG TPA: portal protein [Gemmatimonadales bacterium]
MNLKQLIEDIEHAFAHRSSLMMLLQEQAENFYPQRADFTVQRHLGADFASNLQTSYPIIVAREMSDQIGTMLRPTAKPWFYMKPEDPDRENIEARRWLDRAQTIQRLAMYDRATQFTKAMKRGDADYAVFGQCPMSARLNRTRDRLLFQNWHIRDVVWLEDAEETKWVVARKWKPTARDLQRTWGDKISDKVKEQLRKGHDFERTNCYHIVVMSELYDFNAGGWPYVSIHYDADHKYTMEEKRQRNKEYFIPQWQKVSGSQYAYSPAVVAALPDARLLQAIAVTLLEAGEKITNPPMLAVIDAVKSDMEIFAGGTTWLDRDYDEKMGEALRPMNIDAKGMPIGLEMMQDCRQILGQAFYLNKLTLPQRTPEMTAYEVGQRVQEYIRAALPLFEPMEDEYNGQLCEVTFDLLMNSGGFGSELDMPKSLRGAKVDFHFVSPLHDAIEQLKGAKFLEMGQYISAAVQLDPSTATIIDAPTTLRDVLKGVGVPAKWTRTEDEAKAIAEQHQAAANAQAALTNMQTGSQAIANLAAASKDRAAAGAQP